MVKRILIVEDEFRNRKLLKDLLRRFDYDVMEASDGLEAVEMVKAWRPDLILMDIQMPVMDGFEATRIIKNDPETSHIPIIAITAYAMEGDRERILQAGCDDYISKPIEIKDFLAKIENFLKEEGD
ncbi:MAG TPA: response regulator [Desulfobacteraceae bacterium]|nr:response regulator [Desulfobacteraceae bacterium]